MSSLISAANYIKKTILFDLPADSFMSFSVSSTSLSGKNSSTVIRRDGQGNSKPVSDLQCGVNSKGWSLALYAGLTRLNRLARNHSRCTAPENAREMIQCRHPRSRITYSFLQNNFLSSRDLRVA